MLCFNVLIVGHWPSGTAVVQVESATECKRSAWRSGKNLFRFTLNCLC